MKIETARNILIKYGCQVPQNCQEAKEILDQYSDGKIDFCGDGIDQQAVREIYNALSIILCSEMGKENRPDPKRKDREAAEERKKRLNIR